MPDREKQIYNSGADQYERLIVCEDYQGSLLPAIEAITHLDHLHAVDLGTGTGRLVRLLASRTAAKASGFTPDRNCRPGSFRWYAAGCTEGASAGQSNQLAARLSRPPQPALSLCVSGSGHIRLVGMLSGCLAPGNMAK